MAWVAFDRAVKAVEMHGLSGPVDHWRDLRSRIHREICERAYDAQRETFVQSYSDRNLDASLLIMPLVGFLPPEDARIRGTLRALERELLWQGFVLRYRTSEARDGLPAGEGVFLPCSFWLADNFALVGEHEKAHALFERLLALRNDVGLLSEEYDPVGKRMLGNFPQAFTHLSVVNTACNLMRQNSPAEHRSGASPKPKERR
jgi:GH15 family glucan-1,4-alpha-glucosidase